MDANNVTRRQILKRFGILGGSSIMLGAMDAWGLRGQASRPRPKLRGTRADTRVIVLGGGISGLVTGYELRKLEYDYHVLEARGRVGGLAWSPRRGATHTEIDGETQACDFDEGQYFNAGPWRIPNSDEGLLGYCEELGVPLELFINWSDANYFYEDDPSLGSLASKPVRFREVKADLWGSTAELLAKAMDKGEIDAPLTSDDKELLVEFLVRAGYLDSDNHLYKPPTSRGSEDRYDLSSLLHTSFWTRVRSLYAGTGGPDPLFQPIGGMAQIPFALHRAQSERVTLNAEVTQVRQTEDEVRVVWRDTRTGQQHEEVADYVVCCLPMSILKGLDVNLSDDMAAAVQETGHSNSAKMGLQMKRRFWELDDGIYGGHLWSSSLELGEFSYPSNGYFTDKGVLLGFYGGGSTADLDQKPFTARIEHVLSEASKVHPQIRDAFEAAYCVWWQKVPYSQGAYGRTPSAELLAKLSQPDGRIYLGSAGVSTHPAWMEGAVQSAWRSVEAIHARAMQQ